MSDYSGVIEKRLDDKRAVRLEGDGHTCHLFTCDNGAQWSGAPIRSVEMAEAAIVVLQQYVSLQKMNGQIEANASEASSVEFFQGACMSTNIDWDLLMDGAEAIERYINKGMGSAANRIQRVDAIARGFDDCAEPMNDTDLELFETYLRTEAHRKNDLDLSTLQIATLCAAVAMDPDPVRDAFRNWAQYWINKLKG